MHHFTALWANLIGETHRFEEVLQEGVAVINTDNIFNCIKPILHYVLGLRIGKVFEQKRMQ